MFNVYVWIRRNTFFIFNLWAVLYLKIQVKKMIQEIEQRRVEYVKLLKNKNKRKISKYLKTPEMIELETQQAKWKTSKVLIKI